MACVGMESCYHWGSSTNCCGCANWEEDGLPVPPFPDTETCKNKNPLWTQKIKPTIKWFKEACPTAYTYPFDDMSSTFVCKNMIDKYNIVNYEITFCPNNEVRAPTSKPKIVQRLGQLHN